MTDWLSSGGWGTREQAIPGEWAMLVLIIVGLGALGFLVLWFTMLRHERTVLHRARYRTVLEPGMLPGSATSLFRLDPIEEADEAADEVAGHEVAAPDAAEAAESADAEESSAEAVSADEPESESEPEREREPEPEAEAEAEAPDSPESEGENERRNADENANESENEPEPAASVAAEPVAASLPSSPAPAARRIEPPKGQRKLTEEILSRVENEMAEREGWHWKDLAAFVHREFGVSVHPSTIQRALRKRRHTEAADPASA